VSGTREKSIPHRVSLRGRTRAKKIIAGVNNLYTVVCPNCGESECRGELAGICPECDYAVSDNEVRIGDTDILATNKRRPVSRKLREQIRNRQENKCYWCGRIFGSYYVRNNKKVTKLKMHVDHNEPYSFNRRHEKGNLVGACNICNLFKSNKMFKTEKECREYLKDKWYQEIQSGKIEFELSEIRGELAALAAHDPPLS